ncbi:MAG TPA: prolyl oligopeptidase family serine peptidase, partial [Pirellulaceae bacterium]|nr:prolyl oligopeptidase family serine peptidase [Pirellulaceae bacterium]
APAGTPLITGNDVDAGDYHDETLPYAQAGMVAIMYSLDGPAPETQLVAPIAAAYKQFKAAKGGVVNGRNALEFAVQKLPQVDPQRIYTAGHSSAATVSLLVAAHEPRVKACLAYAPCCDVELRLKDLANDWQATRAMPGLANFLRDTSPKTHLGKYQCPVFVFHAKDDSNEPFSTTERFVTAMRQANANITFGTSDHGDHYESMIQFGIPQGIAWLKQLP